MKQPLWSRSFFTLAILSAGYLEVNNGIIAPTDETWTTEGSTIIKYGTVAATQSAGMPILPIGVIGATILVALVTTTRTKNKKKRTTRATATRKSPGVEPPSTLNTLSPNHNLAPGSALPSPAPGTRLDKEKY